MYSFSGNNEEIKISDDLIEMYSGEYVDDVFIESIEIYDDKDANKERKRYVSFYSDLMLPDYKGDIQEYKAIPFSFAAPDDEVDGFLDFSVNFFKSKELIDVFDSYTKPVIKYAIFKEKNITKALTGYSNFFVSNITINEKYLVVSGKGLRALNKDINIINYTEDIFPCI